MDYGKNTNKEKLVEDAIAKAKELIQEMGENNGIKLDETLLGEEVKVSRPPKKGKEENTTMPKDANQAFAGDMNEG
tara:strand:- start:612 stop:839 length:228 start_codon:yes stop_codon:yes gene_type:complete